jgi:hypothetical protein
MKMAKQKVGANPLTLKIFEDLDNFLDFCRDYGYRFNQADLYNFKSYAWQQYSKFTNGKNAKNMWEEDAKRFASHR